MNKYLITYDLANKQIKSYENLYTALKSLGPWWHYLDSTWIIKTNINSKDIWNNLKDHINTNNDRILITKISDGDREGWLTKDAWDWLNQN